MASATPRPRRRDARPAELLAAALDTFAAKGFAATRMEDIAARAGVAKGTVYLYYPSKEAIFEALVREAILPNIARLEALVEAAPPGAASAAAQLRLLIGAMGEVLGNPRIVAIPKLVLAEAGNFPELARFYRREVAERGLRLIEGILRRGVAAGEFRPLPDPRVAARLFISPVLVTALWQTTFAPHEDAPIPPAAVLAQHAETFLRGIAAEGGPPP
jgi:AcrR family transcriptional regulator